MQNKKAVKVTLTDKQAERLIEIRNEYGIERMHSELDYIFYFALRGMSESLDCDEAADYLWAFYRAKQLAEILLQPETDV